MTTMDQRNVNDRRRPLPDKIERRLAELLTRGEFDQGEEDWCRRSYWSARDDWHSILVACYESARARARSESRACISVGRLQSGARTEAQQQQSKFSPSSQQ